MVRSRAFLRKNGKVSGVVLFVVILAFGAVILVSPLFDSGEKDSRRVGVNADLTNSELLLTKSKDIETEPDPRNKIAAQKNKTVKPNTLSKTDKAYLRQVATILKNEGWQQVYNALISGQIDPEKLSDAGMWKLSVIVGQYSLHQQLDYLVANNIVKFENKNTLHRIVGSPNQLMKSAVVKESKTTVEQEVIEKLKIFVKYGFTVNENKAYARSDGSFSERFSAVEKAAIYGYPEVLEYLLNVGAEPVNSELLWRSVINVSHSEDIAEMLLERGYIPDKGTLLEFKDSLTDEKNKALHDLLYPYMN